MPPKKTAALTPVPATDTGTDIALADRSSGGEQTHLSDAARALLIERIIAGDTNKAINAALVAANHLPKGGGLSPRTLTEYRRLPEVRIDARRLTVEAMQVGHAAVSQAILHHVQVMESALAVVLPGGKFVATVGDREKLAAALFDKSTKFLMNSLWSSGLPDSIKDETRLADMAEKMKTADSLPEAEKLRLMLDMRDSLNGMLRALIERMRMGNTAPATPATATPTPADTSPNPATAPAPAAIEGTASV